MGSDSGTYQQQAYQYIKEQIFTVGFKPGEYIQDNKIANKLEISRTPVREAFQRLENEGLLVYEAHRGWKVYVLSLHDINEIFDLKLVIEGMTARKAADCEDEKLCLELRATLQKMEEAVETNNLDNWIEADTRLHDIIFELAGNQRALNILRNLNDQWHRIRGGFVARTGRMEESLIEHQAFVDAILAGNGDEAERLMVNHLVYIRDDLINLLVNLVLPFVDEGV